MDEKPDPVCYVFEKTRKLKSMGRKFNHHQCPRDVSKPAQRPVNDRLVSSGHTEASPEDRKNQILLYHSPGPRSNLNGEFSQVCDGIEEEIVCYQLAYSYASGKFRREKSKFSSLNALTIMDPTKVFSNSEIDERFHLRGCSSYAIYFNPSKISDALYAISLKLKDGDDKSYLFSSGRHLMALRFKKCEKKGIVIKFYDPNSSVTHKNLIATSIDCLKHISLNDLLAKWKISWYFPRGMEGACLLGLDTTQKQSQCRVKCFGEANNLMITLSIKYGHYGHPELPFNIASHFSQKQDTEKRHAGTLHLAIQREYYETLEAWLHDIQASSIDKTQKADLLAGKTPDHTPIFYIAAELGLTRFASSYVPAILASDLNNTQKVELIKGEDADGTSSLFFAAQLGHGEFIRICLQSVLASNLDEADKVELLNGVLKDTSGTGALSVAVQEGHANVVEVILHEILSSSLSEANKIKLVDGRDSYGVSAFRYASERPGPEIARIFIQAILSSPLDKAQKTDLLAGKRTDHTPVFYTTAEYNLVEFARLYTAKILTSDLDNKQKIELITGADDDGTHALFFAAQLGNEELVRIITQSILTSNLDEADKVELLSAKVEDGTPALSVAVQMGHSNTVGVFVREILSSSLSEANKAELFSGKNAEGISALFFAVQAGDQDTILLLNNVSANKTHVLTL